MKPNITDDNSLCEYAIQCALDAGCREAKVVLQSSTSDSVEWRDGEQDYVSGEESRSMAIELFVDGRYSIVDTNRLNYDTLRQFINTNVANTRHLAEDRHRYLPKTEEYYQSPKDDDLGLVDPHYFATTFEQKSEVANALCSEMSHPDTVSATAAVSSSKQKKVVMTSNGFCGKNNITHYSISANISVKGYDDERTEDYMYTASTRWGELTKSDIGTAALNKAIAKRGAKRIASGRYNIVVDRLVVSKLLNPLIAAIGGNAQYYKNSFLLDKKGEQIVSPLLTLTDTPTQRGMIGAALFDNECRPLSDMPIIKDGTLCNYLISLYMSRKMNITATRGGTTILEFGNCCGTQANLIAQMERGLLITGFNGGNSNATTGDFSFGIEGFMVENGICIHPISEMLITGNMLTLWNNLVAVADDAPNYVSWHTPSLLFAGVDIS